MTTTKISTTAQFLEDAYKKLNKDKFSNELQTPIITIQDTRGVYGHVTCSKVWKHRNGKEQYELNIGAATLNRPIAEVIATLLHEMVHIYHLQNGVQDTSRGGAYHNKTFKEKAESVGLIIEYDKKIGWSVTRPSKELIQYVKDNKWRNIDINRGLREASGDDPRIKKPSSTRKYQCPCCGNSVRATKDIRIICADCSQMMEKCS